MHTAVTCKDSGYHANNGYVYSLVGVVPYCGYHVGSWRVDKFVGPVSESSCQLGN